MKLFATYLYIKQHSITGKLYFGKTVRKDPIKYLGSGTHWSRHIKKHGKEHVITLWHELFVNEEDCIEFALSFSEGMDIVKSDQWLNLKPENGLDGGSDHHSETSKEKMKLSHIGKSLSQSAKDKLSSFWKGRPKTDIQKQRMKDAQINMSPEKKANQLAGQIKPKSIETKQKMKIAALNRSVDHNIKIGLSQKGKIIPEEQKQKIRDTLLNATPIKCPHCDKVGSISNMKRWHFDNCKVADKR